MRLELTRKTDLALRGLLELARWGDGLLKRSELAELIESTDGFVAQVMSPLVGAGWVDSERGPNGGYRLVKDLSTVTVLELIELTEGPVEHNRCVLRGTPCPPTEKCALHEAWSKARTALLAELSQSTVADVEH